VAKKVIGQRLGWSQHSSRGCFSSVKRTGD
jgi:hypothetical protein